MNILLLIMSAIIIVMLINNVRKVKEMRKDSAYVDAYMKVLKGEEDAKDNLEKYLLEEKNIVTKNRALIVKAYLEENDEDIKKVIDEINFDEILLENGKYVPENINKSSDSFIWLILLLSKIKDKELLTYIYDKVNRNELEKHVEFLVLKAAYEIFVQKEDRDVSFLNKLLAGEYVGFIYDKTLIGIYKKFAVSLLIYDNQNVLEDDEIMMKDFVSTQVGNQLLTNLGLKEKYLEKQEELKEEIEENKEESQENKEETKEE